MYTSTKKDGGLVFFVNEVVDHSPDEKETHLYFVFDLRIINHFKT
jgi:hypothetical protein